MSSTPPDEPTIYERAGGEQAFMDLIDSFYGRVADDAVLRPVYPDDLEPGKQALTQFFIQYWGGPTTYSEQRGHPRLRMRHASFRVTPEGARRWAAHMLAAIDEQGFPADVAEALRAYVVRFTPQMVNAFDEPDEPVIPKDARHLGPS